MDTKKTEGKKAVQQTTAEKFREKFQLGKSVTSSTGTEYRIRPIAPHFYLTSWTKQILQFIPDEIREKAKEEKREITAKEIEEYVPVEERLNTSQMIRPVLIEGVLDPKIIDAKKEDRKLITGELDVDELLGVMDEALFLFNEIHALSRSDRLPGGSFPGHAERR
ncbi:unnamed protein product, partial [marine sediment metagenome]